MPHPAHSLVAFLLLAAATTRPTTGPATGPTTAPTSRPADIVLGHVACMTGSQATFGLSADQGMRLAVEELNASGGVLGRRVQLITWDDRSRTEEAELGARRLILQDHVVALLGATSSARTLALAPVAQKHGVPVLTPTATNPQVTAGREFVFRACVSDPAQAAAMARYATENLKHRRYAILRHRGSDYSRLMADGFAEAARVARAEVVAEAEYEPGERNFRVPLEKIRAARPDAVYVPAHYADMAPILTQARGAGMNMPFLGADGCASEELARAAGEALGQCYYTDHFSPDDPDKGVAAFVERYRKRYPGKAPDAIAFLGYDSVKLMADAIRRAGSTEGKAIRDALAATKDFAGTGGPVTIDKERNARRAVVVLAFRGKKPTFAARESPGDP
jgi:branched-chain amino acid transport system substrate-binding protein